MIADLSRIGEVIQNLRNGVFREGLARVRMAPLAGPSLRGPAAPVQFFRHRQYTVMLQVQSEDLPHDDSFWLVDQQSAALGSDIVAQRRNPSHPFALPPRRRHLVPCPFADDLPLELSKGKQNVQCQAPQRSGRVELLRDRDKAHCPVVEHLHDASEVQQRPAQPIDLVDGNAVDPSRLYVHQQLL